MEQQKTELFEEIKQVAGLMVESYQDFYKGMTLEEFNDYKEQSPPGEALKHSLFFIFDRKLTPLSEDDPIRHKEITSYIEEAANKHQEDITNSFYPPIKNVLTKFPEHHQRPTDKISRDLFSGRLNEAPTAFKFEGDGQPEVTREASIFYETLEAVETGLSPLAEEVYNSLISLYEAGNEYITARMVYRSMTGNNRAEVTKDRQEAIEKYIRVCAGTQATIRPITGTYRGQVLEYGGNILTIKWYTLPINGVITKCFQITTPPLLYEHARGLGQIGSCPMKILNVPLNKSDDILLIRQYLLRRVMAVKNENNQGKHRLNEIAYRNLYDLLEIDEASTTAKRKKQKTRENAKAILDYWIGEKYIKSYKEQKKGRAAHKLIITA